jgi:site-specific DNA-methyltransferase (adenine-specific)
MKERAPRNRTLYLTEADVLQYQPLLKQINNAASLEAVKNQVIFGDALSVLDYLPTRSIDLLITDPPYNMSKNYAGRVFSEMQEDDYYHWLCIWLEKLKKTLKPNASLYVCSEWQSSFQVQKALEKFFIIKNRITWEREKGRGAKYNWKNASEDIWFCTMSDDYYFDVDAVKMKRKVIAPYKDEEGKPKDWESTEMGDFRTTHPSNLWTDISVPFWSMPENTDHPTQKPEKLVAKLILASSKVGDVVFDPFLGSGTTAVVAKKLGRSFVAIEQMQEYCLLAQKRLHLAETDKTIQGYIDGYFWERNSLNFMQQNKVKNNNLLKEDLFS